MAKMFGEILDKQYQLLVEDWKYREEHQVTFNAQVREVLRLLEDLSYQQVNEEVKGFQLYEENEQLSWRVGSLLTKMSDEITRECKRLKCWAVLGDGIGAHLVANGKQEILTQEDLIAPDGSLLAPDVVHIDPLTDLIFPNLDAQMILPNNHAISVPRDYFVHPQTGKVLPIMGNVCYDPKSSRLVITSDNTRDKARRIEEHPVPYVPFPIFYKTGLPVNCRLQALKPGMVFRFGAPMEDPASGIIVPILAITIHPHTGVVYPLGGTYLSPITNMTEVIEIGGIMIDNKTGQAVPILGVGINPHSGGVIPVGGTLSPSTSALLPGDNFVEPLSGKTVRIAGASLHRSKVIPHAGGYGSLLDTYALTCQIHVMDLLKEYKDSIMKGLTLSVEHPLSKKGALKATLADLAQYWSSRQQLLMQTKCDLEHEEHLIQSLISSGGSQGMIKYPGTNLFCHAVIGMLYPDPEGSRMEVPLLGVYDASNTRQLIPLAGTMEDANGKGLVPISIGARTVDPVTGEVGTVVGARLDPLKNIVLPVTHSYHPLIKQKMRFELIDQVENEIGARCKHYEQQKKKEDTLFQELSTSLRSCLDSVTQGKYNKTQWNSSGKSLKLTSSALLQASTTEMQRRAMQVSNMDSVVFPNVVLLLNKVDNDEGDLLLQLMNLIQELVQKVTLYFEKLDQEEKRLKVQAMKQIVGVEMKSHKQTKDHLLKEIWEFVLTHQAMLDRAFSRLEYLRCLSNMYTRMAKDILTGKSYCFGDYQISENNNNKKTQRGAQLSQTHLIPLLKQLITLLEEKNQNSLTTLTKTQPEEDYDQIVAKSPLLRLLKTVNKQLRASAKAVGILETEHLSEEAAAVPVDHTQDNRSEFLDLLDAQLVCEGDLTSVNLDSLSAREFIVYQHGLSLLNFLESHICAPRITLLLAATLPSNQYVNNAFRNSFFFEEAKKILFIRRQCLESVGGFTLLLLHCLSHITAEDLAYDSNPVFIRLFHQALKACFSDYFFTRLQLTSSCSPHKELLRVLQNTLLCGEPCSADTRNTLSHLLHQRVDEPTEKEFFQEQTVDHMMRYKKAAACCTVENLLKEEKLATKTEYFQQSQESTASKYNRRNSKDEHPTAINEDIQEGLACKVKEHSMLPEPPPRTSTQISSSPSNPSSLPNRESLIHQIRELELECGLLSQAEVDVRSNLQLESSGELG
ncbi:uncharacterized protein si:dkey-103g5.4 [Erpetoichthys calabaricus]|uniref:uncharacterized protein si:dkey-103g5.4 n=1 Tax=Erpetoichthys calabaricus TaxID=27687 RepID=UPI0022345313|nr:uncharacterized protein si:dkey-103g5.4 [Erpetoichthys calabaricus]